MFSFISELKRQTNYLLFLSVFAPTSKNYVKPKNQLYKSMRLRLKIWETRNLILLFFRSWVNSSQITFICLNGRIFPFIPFFISWIVFLFPNLILEYQDSTKYEKDEGTQKDMPIKHYWCIWITNIGYDFQHNVPYERIRPKTW